MVKDANRDDNKKKSTAIRKIILVERTRRSHKRILQAPGSKRGGSLSKIEVPIEYNGKIVGWKTLCETEEVHEAIVARNIKHLDQASETPFGSGEGYEHLHGPDRWKNMHDITNRVSKFKGATEEINKWIDSLQRAYGPNKLRRVVDHINEPITAQEFVFFCRKKGEHQIFPKWLSYRPL